MLADWLMLAQRVIGIGASAQATAVSSSTITISKPDAVGAGALMIAFITNSTNAVPTPPAGWTLIGAALAGRAAYAKTATASEPASYTWTFPGAVSAQGFMVVLGGGQLDIGGSWGSGGNAPSVTATAANSLAILYYGTKASGSVTWSTPSGWTPLLADADSQTPSSALFFKRVDAGATGDAVSITTGAWGGMQMVIKPK